MVTPLYLNGTAMAAKTEISNLYKAFFGKQAEFLEICHQAAYCIDVQSNDLFYEGTFQFLPANFDKHTVFPREACTVKQFVARLFVDAIEQLYATALPWGILTGIRPQKLYRKLRQVHSQSAVRELAKTLYLLKEDKIRYLEQIYEIQHPVLTSYTDHRWISLYIGIPYCPSKCSYCTFCGHICPTEAEQTEYFAALIIEMRWVLLWAKERGLKVAAIYIGGGTPATLSSRQIEELLTEIDRHLLEPCKELSFEAGRADVISEEILLVLQRMGVERISINPQTFRDSTLANLNRNHTADDVIRVYDMARRIGFRHINMDIILGLPGESAEDIAYTLSKLEELRPEAVTMHALALKTKSSLQQQWELERFKQHTANFNEMLAVAEPWARDNHYLPYYLYRQKNIAGNMENIGYSLPGMHSLYNIFSMEETMPIVGIGCGAVSKLVNKVSGKIERLANPADPRYYIRTIEQVLAKKQKQLPQILTNL